MEEIWTWLASLEWHRLVPETIGKAVGFLLGFGASWFLLFRRKLQELRRFQLGESDEILFQMHKLISLEGTDQEVALIFRNAGPKTTINQLYENEAARDLIRRLADATSLAEPILKTEGTSGFELVNDAMGHIAGYLAIAPFERETWLFMMTCEDRKVVRKKCIRCFLIRPDDLARFADWTWCSTKVRVEKPWHAYRIVALHHIALAWQKEQNLSDDIAGWKSDADSAQQPGKPEPHHDRIRLLSVGLHPGEKLVGQALAVNWTELQSLLKEAGKNKPGHAT